MTIQDQLLNDMRLAMKSKNDVVKNTVRLIRSAVQYEEKANGEIASDDVVIGVLSRMARQYKESIEAYDNAGRQDLVEKEKAQLEIILGYLPEQLDRETVFEIAKSIAEDLGASGMNDRGKVMGALMPRVRGKAEGSLVNSVVVEILESIGEKGPGSVD